MPRIPEKKIVSGTVKGDKLTVMGATLSLPTAIRPADDEYEIHIPTQDFTLGGKIKAQYVADEDVNGQRLVQMNVNGEAVFVLADEDSKTDGGISIELKHCTFISNGEEVVSPLPFDNELQGKLIRNKILKEVKKDDGSVKKVKATEFTLNVNGIEFKCPDDVADKIIAGCGKYAFKIPLGVRFSPEAGKLYSEGIPVNVEKIYDYGTGKYALCTVKVEKPAENKKEAPEIIEKKIFVAVTDEQQTGASTLYLDIANVGVYDLEQDIRLI